MFGVMYKYTMLAVKCIYACYQMCICLLSNVYLLAAKCIFACCQIQKLLYRCSCSITQNIG